MRSLFATLRQLTLPMGAPPGTPRRVIGPDVPAALQAYFAGFGAGYAVVHADLWYFDGGVDYYWEALLDTHVGDAFERGHPSGFTIGGTVYLYRLLNFDISSGNVVRDSFGGFGADREEYVFSGAAGSRFDITSAVNLAIDGISAPRGLRDGNATNNGTVATSVAGAEAAVPSASWDSEPTFDFLDGHLYEAHLTGAAINPAATAQTAQVRVRKGAATTAGTQLARIELAGAAGFAGLGIGFGHRFYIKNVSGATVSTKLSATIQRIAGAANYSLFGDADRPLRIDIEHAGLVAEQPGPAADAGSV